jgi:lipoprotein-releasing system permease protein
MSPAYPLWIGWRLFRAGSGNRLVSFVSLLAVAGLVLGVALMIVVLAVMNGFDREMRERILGLVPHLQLMRSGGIGDWREVAERIAGDPQVVAAEPFVRLAGMLNHHGRSAPVELLGAAPGSRYAALAPLPDGEGLLVSQRLAERLGAAPGATLTLFVPAAGDALPVARAFRVAGVFATHTVLDNALVIASLAAAADIAGLGGRVQGLQVELRDPLAARDTGYRLLGRLPADYRFIDWIQTHGNLYQAIQMSRKLVGILVFAVIAIAVFNVVALLVMTVVEKRPAIAILKTQGATRRGILAVFMTQGALIGLLGTALGSALGIAGALSLGELVRGLEQLFDFRFLSLSVYPIDYLPADLRLGDVLLVGSIGLGLNLLAALYPAWRAAAVPPAQVLRYE